MPEQIPQEVKEERHQYLLNLMNRIGLERYKRYVGRKVQILVEGPSKKNPERLMGRTRCNRIVVFEGSPRHIGNLLDVKITRAGTFTLYGDPVIFDE